MKKVSLVMVAVLYVPLSVQAQTPSLHLRVVGDVRANRALRFL